MCDPQYGVHVSPKLNFQNVANIDRNLQFNHNIILQGLLQVERGWEAWEACVLGEGAGGGSAWS